MGRRYLKLSKKDLKAVREKNRRAGEEKIKIIDGFPYEKLIDFRTKQEAKEFIKKYSFLRKLCYYRIARDNWTGWWGIYILKK